MLWKRSGPFEQLKVDVSELFTRHSLALGAHLPIHCGCWVFTTEKQEKDEAITVCFSLKPLGLISEPMLKLGRSSCPIGLSPVGANHSQDQILPCLSILRKVEQVLSTALTPFCYVVQPLATWTSSSGFPLCVFDQSVIIHSADMPE